MSTCSRFCFLYDCQCCSWLWSSQPAGVDLLLYCGLLCCCIILFWASFSCQTDGLASGGADWLLSVNVLWQLITPPPSLTGTTVFLLKCCAVFTRWLNFGLSCSSLSVLFRGRAAHLRQKPYLFTLNSVSLLYFSEYYTAWPETLTADIKCSTPSI